VRTVYQRFSRRPSWVWGGAALIGLAPFALLIALLAVGALLTTAVVYAVLAAVHEIGLTLGRLTGGGGAEEPGGRRNVRVVGREDRGD